MIEIAFLASTIVSSFLIPLVKDGATTLQKKLSQTAGEAGADSLVKTSETLWDRIRGKAKPGPEQAAVDTFAQSPDLMKEAIEKIVRAQLEADPEFRAQATALLEQDQGGGKKSWQVMGETVGIVDLQGGHVSGGFVAGVVVGAPDPRLVTKSTPPAPAPDRPDPVDE